MKKTNWMGCVLVMILWLCPAASLTKGQEKASPSDLQMYAGKLYKGFQDPEFITYDMALRENTAQRIKKKFGLTIDPRSYSGFDLLEIEAFLKCKKKGEAFDTFLEKFPKRPLEKRKSARHLPEPHSILLMKYPGYPIPANPVRKSSTSKRDGSHGA